MTKKNYQLMPQAKYSYMDYIYEVGYLLRILRLPSIHDVNSPKADIKPNYLRLESGKYSGWFTNVSLVL